MSFAAAREKLAQLMGPLELQELQERLNQLRQPKEAGTIATPGGGTAGITFQGGKYGTQQIQPGLSGAAAKQEIQKMAAAAPNPEYKATLQSYADSIDAGQDPLTALGKAQALMGQAAGRVETNAQKTRFKMDYKNGLITDADGKEWSIYDPNLPPGLKQFVESAKKRESEEETKKINEQARANALALDRSLKAGDMREAQKGYDAVLKLAQRGVAGHSFLKTVENQVEAAKQGGGEGTTSGDMLIVEGFMQSMFGVDPRALRGSPKMMETLLKQGGWDDRSIAAMNGVLAGGKLSQNVREQILDNTKTQIESWDQAIEQTGQLVENPKVQDLVNRYKRAVGASRQTQGKTNDLSDLGGTPAVKQ